MIKFFIAIVFYLNTAFATPIILSLDDAINTAIANNQNLKISSLAIKVANAQYQQALSLNYPQIDVKMNVSRTDEDSILKIRSNFTLPQDITNSITLSNALVKDTLQHTSTELPSTFLNVQNGLIPQQSIPLDMDAKLLGRDTAQSNLNITYPIYTGGKITSLIKQSDLNKGLQIKEYIRTESQVIYDVKRFYHAVVLSEKLYLEAKNLLKNLKATEELTEIFYSGKSLKIKRNDYLNIRMMTKINEAFVKELEAKVEQSKAGLVNVIGLPWNTEISVMDNQFKPYSVSINIADLIRNAHNNNPEMAKLKLALQISDEKINALKGDVLPQLILAGNLQNQKNSYKEGLINDSNENSWTIALGMNWNLFDGYKNKYAIEEEKILKEQMKTKEALFTDGIAVQIKNTVLQLENCKSKSKLLNESMELASENSNLTFEAYKEDILTLKEVLDAQIYSFFINSLYLQNEYELHLNDAQLEYIISDSLSRK